MMVSILPIKLFSKLLFDILFSVKNTFKRRMSHRHNAPYTLFSYPLCRAHSFNINVCYKNCTIYYTQILSDSDTQTVNILYGYIIPYNIAFISETVSVPNVNNLDSQRVVEI